MIELAKSELVSLLILAFAAGFITCMAVVLGSRLQEISQRLKRIANRLGVKDANTRTD